MAHASRTPYSMNSVDTSSFKTPSMFDSPENPSSGGGQQHGSPSTVQSNHRNVTTASQISSTKNKETTAADLPEEAPIFFRGQLPSALTIPRKLWEIIYSIMRDGCLRSSTDGSQNWISMQNVISDYARRTRQPLSTEYIKQASKGGAKTVKQFFIDNPWIDHEIRPDNSVWLKLRNPAIARSKKSRPQCDVRMRSKKTLADTDFYNDEFYDPIDLKLPPRPPNTLPVDVEISDSLRERVYRLLSTEYPNGIDISSFSQAYVMKCGLAFCPRSECKGVSSTDYFFKCIDDLVRSRIGDGGILWVEPIKRKEIMKKAKQQQQQQQAESSKVDVGGGAAYLSKKREKVRPPSPSVLNQLFPPSDVKNMFK